MLTLQLKRREVVEMEQLICFQDNFAKKVWNAWTWGGYNFTAEISFEQHGAKKEAIGKDLKT